MSASCYVRRTLQPHFISMGDGLEVDETGGSDSTANACQPLEHIVKVDSAQFSRWLSMWLVVDVSENLLRSSSALDKCVD